MTNNYLNSQYMHMRFSFIHVGLTDRFSMNVTYLMIKILFCKTIEKFLSFYCQYLNYEHVYCLVAQYTIVLKQETSDDYDFKEKNLVF